MLIATIHPALSFRQEIAGHLLVDGLRFNTVKRAGEQTPQEQIAELLRICGKKPLWIDLKSRQLRITKYADPTYEYVELSHRIRVDLPTWIYFKNGRCRVVEIVDGNKLILEERPPQGPVGAGEAVNILDPTLEIEGFLTERDQAYIEAAKPLGVHHYMLSFVEKEDDIRELVAFDPQAQIVAKIESLKGLRFVKDVYPQYPPGAVRLMVARDDLYINLCANKQGIIGAEQLIIGQDPTAIVASRILTSLEQGEEISMGDIKDLYGLTLMGYKNFMFSDGLCFWRSAFRRAMIAYQNWLAFLELEGGKLCGVTSLSG